MSRKQAGIAAFGYVCAASWPFANYLNFNLSQLAIGAYGPLDDLFLLLVSLILPALILAALPMRQAALSIARWLTTATVVVALVFLSSTVNNFIGQIGTADTLALAATCIAIILLAALVWLLSRFEPFRFAVAASGVAALAIPLWSLGSAWLALPEPTANINRPAYGAANRGAPLSGDNLYFVVLDGYGRADALLHNGFDNSGFVAQLEERGFFVDPSALSNYTSTHVSIMAMLDAEYPVDQTSPRYSDRALFYPTALNTGTTPSAVARFASGGYHTVRVSNGWGGCNETIFDRCFVEGGQEISYPMRSFLEATVIPAIFPGLVTPPPETPANDAVEILGQRFFEITSQQPMFLFAHALAPHPPYRYGADCEPRTSNSNDESSAEISRPLFFQMLSCVNRNVINLVDRITATDPDGLIVLIADHGTDFSVDWLQRLEDWPAEAQLERLSILSASKFPVECAGYHQPGMGQINVMRAAMACLARQPVDLLPERSFLTVYENSVEFGRVVPSAIGR